MEENEAIKMLAEWDTIADPTDADSLLFWLSSWISEKEQDLTELEGRIAQVRKTFVVADEYSVAKADVFIKASEQYMEMRRLENKLMDLKSAKANVKRRYEIITNKLLQNRRY